MRLIAGILLILVGLGWLASEIPLSQAQPGRSQPTGWRRTAHGWERSGTWTAETNGCRPAVHPVVIGLFQLFLALAFLVAFSTDRDAAQSGVGRRISRLARRT